MSKTLSKCICVVIFLITASCSSTLSRGNYPDWYTKQPKNTQTSLYGVGEGGTLDSAKDMALKNISEQILVTVSSTSDVYKAETNVEYIEESKFDVSERTEEITFSDYKVLKSTSSKDRFFVLLEVDKQELIQLQKDELQKIETEISTLDKNSKRKTSLERVASLLEIKELAKRADIKIKVIRSLEPSFNGDAYYARYNKYNEEYIDLIHNITFYIKTNDSFDKKIADVFKKHLNKYNIKTVDNFNTKLTILDIYSDSSTKKIYGSYNTKARISLVLLVKGMTIRSNSLELKGSSTINRKEAENNAIKSLDKRIEEEGLFRVLRLMK